MIRADISCRDDPYKASAWERRKRRQLTPNKTHPTKAQNGPRRESLGISSSQLTMIEMG